MSNPDPRVLVLLSGGLDSTVLTAEAVDKFGSANVEAISFNYGQRHERELRSAAFVARRYSLRHRIVVLDSIAPHLKSALVREIGSPDRTKIPEGHYADESMKATVVPGRNLIMLSIAAGIAESQGLKAVLYAAHAGDHPIYPDCRPEFYRAAEEAVKLGSGGGVRLSAPFIEIDKTAVVKLGAALHAPLEHTWSCYNGRQLHCGKCGTCVERIEAFELAGVKDPTTYE